jgi:hypothetical protein
MNMVEMAPTALERRKRQWIAVSGATLSAILLLAIIRWTPSVDNWITGGFHPIRTIALKAGEALATTAEPHLPVAVFACHQCATADLTVADISAPNRFFAVGYDEALRAVSVMALSNPYPSGRPSTVLKIDPAKVDAVFGPPLKQPVDAVVVGYRLTFFTDYISRSIDPRVPLKSLPPGTDADFQGGGRFVRPDLVPNFLADIDARGDRPLVAHHHDVINRLLLGIMVVCGVAAAFALRQLRARYRDARSRFALWGAPLTVKAFIGGDFLQRCADAERSYHQAQEREAAQARADTIARRNRMAVLHKAEALLRLQLPEELRLRLQRAVERDDVQAMSSASREAEAAIAERPAEQRLEALLEPLRDLCSAEQWEEYRARASALLQSSGFRQARDFVVSAHARLRAEADAAEDASAAAAS